MFNFSIDFNQFLETAPPTLIFKPDIPAFSIVAANSAYLQISGLKIEEIVGKGVLDTFQTTRFALGFVDLNAFSNSYGEVLHSKKQFVLPIQKFHFLVPGTNNLNLRYWKSTVSPILDLAGQVEYIVHTIFDITSDLDTSNKHGKSFKIATMQPLNMEEGKHAAYMPPDSSPVATVDSNPVGFTITNHVQGHPVIDNDGACNFETVTRQVRSDYRGSVFKELEDSLALDRSLDIEFPVQHGGENKVRWMRVTGKVFRSPFKPLPGFSGTISDITQQKLEEICKSKLFAIVSHELKTPLTSAKAYVQVLLKKALDSQDGFTITALERTLAQIDKMHDLVKGFLDVARIEDGKVELDKEVFDLPDLLKEVVEEFYHMHQGRRIIVCDSPAIMVLADRNKILQVIRNFLTNAIKYSQQGTNITVRCSLNEGMAVLCVRDEGIGIQREDLEHIFDRFYRVDNPLTQVIAGFGIGLYLSAEIIKRHNGKIWAESEPGYGSEFRFSLPLADRG